MGAPKRLGAPVAETQRVGAAGPQGSPHPGMAAGGGSAAAAHTCAKAPMDPSENDIFRGLAKAKTSYLGGKEAPETSAMVDVSAEHLLSHAGVRPEWPKGVPLYPPPHP